MQIFVYIVVAVVSFSLPSLLLTFIHILSHPQHYSTESFANLSLSSLFISDSILLPFFLFLEIFIIVFYYGFISVESDLRTSDGKSLF